MRRGRGGKKYWARTVDASHRASADIAVRRLVSAIAHRTDPADSLIDAVIVWEYLVGTSTEVTFRVTAALAKLLESDAGKRQSLQKSLKKIYDLRSRVVHGAAVGNEEIRQASKDAVRTAIEILRIAYSRGEEWLELSSEARCNKVLLEWP